MQEALVSYVFDRVYAAKTRTRFNNNLKKRYIVAIDNILYFKHIQ